MPARVIWKWCEAGHRIVEIWSDGNARYDRSWKRDRRLGRVAPQWSVTAAIKKQRLVHRRIENLEDVEEFAELIEASGADVVLSVHFARIVPPALLSRLAIPIVNLHPSILPAYRGATPLVSMVVDDAQDHFSGVSLHHIVPAIDAGPIYASRRVPFPGNKDLRRWEINLARAGSDLVLETIPGILTGEIVGVAQSELTATYRNTVPDDLRVTKAFTVAKLTRLCETLGRQRPLVVDVEGKQYPITRIARQFGPPTGQPSRLNWFYIDTDIADARVRLRRKPTWEGRRRRLQTRLLHIFSH
jgi:methionyl-tRNA formyltransferase